MQPLPGFSQYSNCDESLLVCCTNIKKTNLAASTGTGYGSTVNANVPWFLSKVLPSVQMRPSWTIPACLGRCETSAPSWRGRPARVALNQQTPACDFCHPWWVGVGLISETQSLPSVRRPELVPGHWRVMRISRLWLAMGVPREHIKSKCLVF